MMKKSFIIFAIFLAGVLSCTPLDQPALNVVQDKDVFRNDQTVANYMSALYNLMPMEDFKFSANNNDGFFQAGIMCNISNDTGEGFNNFHVRNGGIIYPARSYWTNAYKLIRQANYFMEHVSEYAANFNNDEQKINSWKGEAAFIRAYTYFALVKRYGGVPVIDKVQDYPSDDMSVYYVPRSSEEDVYDFIGRDLDYAIENLGETSVMRGRANRYVAAAFKSRVMLTAASIARYNDIVVYDKNSGEALTGVPEERADEFFKASWDAAKLLEGKYSLYMQDWKEGDPEAQADNYANLFMSVDGNPECIFAREYKYPQSAHSWDAMFIPYSMRGADAFTGYANPTLDFVELFDGLPKNADGSIKVLDDNGKYRLYENEGAIFDGCEPRLKGTVILPGMSFAGQKVDLRRGVYVGTVPPDGIDPLMPAGDENNNFPESVVQSTANTENEQIQVELPNGVTINASGLDGPTHGYSGTVTGFHLRKMLDPDRPAAERGQWMSDQPWIDMRYAEVLLNRAEAAFELYMSQGNGEYLTDAFNCINEIRRRAGATLLSSEDELGTGATDPSCYIVAPNRGLQIIRVERRKELAFENKIYWDMIRWRTATTELSNRVWRKFNPILVAATADAVSNGQYFFEARNEDSNTHFNFDQRRYYEAIPDGEISRNPNLTQNQGY